MNIPRKNFVNSDKDVATPCFSAYKGDAVKNVTGDGTLYKIIFTWEEYNMGKTYDTKTGLFTAPVDGVYLFQTTVTLINVGDDHTQGYVGIDIDDIIYTGSNCWATRLNVAAIKEPNYYSSCTLSSSVMLNLLNSTQIGVVVKVDGSTKTIGVAGDMLDTLYPATWFEGILLYNIDMS